MNVMPNITLLKIAFQWDKFQNKIKLLKMVKNIVYTSMLKRMGSNIIWFVDAEDWESCDPCSVFISAIFIL